MYKNLHITAIIPALNEAQAIGPVVAGLRALQDSHNLALIDDIIVADNGSTDATAQHARDAGARVVFAARRGYGSACLAALGQIHHTDVVVFVDGDCSVNVGQTPYLLEAIVAGADLVIGSRSLGYIEKGAMTLPQVVGTAVVAKLIACLWQTRVSDLGPFRAIRYPALQTLGMQDPTYGWTVEMQVKALQRQLSVQETPVDCLVRVGQSKVSGTVRGVIGAGFGMLGMVMKLWWRGYAGCCPLVGKAKCEVR